MEDERKDEGRDGLRHRQTRVRMEDGTLLQDLTQDSATLTGWRRTKRSGDGKMIALYSPGICVLRYRSFP